MIKVSKYSVFLPKGNGQSLKIANALYLELLNFGVEMSNDLFGALMSLPEDQAKEVAKELTSEFSIGNVNEPLFKNWESRTFFSFGEATVQILGYLFQFSGNDFDSDDFVARIKREVDIKGFKTLNLASQSELRDYAQKILGATVSQDKKASKEISRIFKYAPEVINGEIKSDEVRIAALIALKDELGLATALKTLRCKPADVLRYSAAIRDWNFVKLPAETKFATLPWSERTALISFLEGFDFDFISEGLGLNRNLWKSFFRHVHLFGQKEFIKKAPVFSGAAYVSIGGGVDKVPDLLTPLVNSWVKEGAVDLTTSGNLAYRTFASRFMSAINEKDFNKISALTKKRAGYVLRNLSTVLNGIQKKDEKKFIALVRDELDTAKPDVLFSLLGINPKSDYRIIDVKGNTIVEKANYSSVIGDIQGDIKRTLRARFGKGRKFIVDPEFKNNIVPFLSKNSELARGSRIKVDTKSVFFFMHWVQDKIRTDLDHSYLAFDADWNPEVVAYYAQANQYLTHGGDITNAPAPKGATEYGKIRVDQIPQKIRYIAPIVNVFTGENFSKLREARAGFWCSDYESFKLSSDATYYNLSADAQMNIPFVLDVKNKEMIVVDFNQRERMGWNAVSYGKQIKEVIEACSSAHYVTIGDLAEILSDGNEVVRISNDGLKPEELFTLFQ